MSAKSTHSKLQTSNRVSRQSRGFTEKKKRRRKKKKTVSSGEEKENEPPA